MPDLTLELFYGQLLRNHVLNSKDEDELLTWMLLLHTHEIHLLRPCLVDAPGLDVLQPATQRSAADAVAGTWGDREDRERTSYRYWYRMYQLMKSYERTKELSLEELDKLRRLRERLESDPLVKAVFL